eukprot:8792239-Pyramimonas_sp.AAC.1
MAAWINPGMAPAAAVCLDRRPVQANWPWIRQCTLSLIEQRSQACVAGHVDREILLSRQIKASAKQDRESWLNDMLPNWDWR